MNIKDVNKTGFMTKKEINEMNFEHIRDLLIFESKFGRVDESMKPEIYEINLRSINAAAKSYKFNKKQVNELKKLANLL